MLYRVRLKDAEHDEMFLKNFSPHSKSVSASNYPKSKINWANPQNSSNDSTNKKDSPVEAMFALKMIKKSKVKKLNMQQFLRREVEIHAHLDHLNVLKFYEYFTDAKHIYLLLELCQSDLYQRLRLQDRFTEKQAAKYLFEICRGFEYLHKKGILHGDIKLENILIGTDGHLKIADFGTAVQTARAPGKWLRRSTFCGTLDYLAPEIVERHTKEYCGNLTDVWALGIMLHEFLTGQAPFEDEDTVKTCKNILKKPIEFSDNQVFGHVSRECVDLIKSNKLRFKIPYNPKLILYSSY